MAIVHQSSATASGTGTAAALTAPSGIAAGDVLIAVLYHNDTVTLPSGWTLIGGANAGNDAGLYLKVAGGSEPGSYTWTQATSGTWKGGISRFSGVDNSTSLDTTVSTNGSAGGSGSAGPITTVTANAMVVGALASLNTVAISPPSGMTEQWDANGVELATVTQGTAGDTGTKTWGASGSTFNEAFLAALRPAPSAPTNTVAPAITGNAWTGHTLSCSTGSWTGSPTGYTFQWKRAGSPIVGATASSYTLQVADEGQAIVCTVTATNGAGSTSADSNSVVPTAAPVPANTSPPAITGNAWTGQTVSCSNGTWSNSPTSFSYQWKRNGANIAGATTSSYVLQGADENQSVKCTVTATNAAGSGSADSNTITPAPAPAPPVNVTPPAISGTTTTGSTISCSTGTWNGAPTSYAYQWKRNGSAISGATASTYILQVADEGQAVKCTVTATNAQGSTSADSNTVNPTSGLQPPANSAAPVISGSTSTGQTLSVDTGTWTNSPTGFTYQWKRSGANIAGATASTYTLVVADEQTAVKCTVTATNGAGSTSADSNVVNPTAPGVAAGSGYTFLDLQDETLGDDFDSSKYRTMVKRALNDALDDIARQVGLPLQEYTFFISTVAGVALYSIPVDDVRLLYAFDSETHNPLQEVTREWIDESDDVRGRPFVFAQWAGQIVFYFTPDRAYNITFRYRKDVTNLLNDTDLVSSAIPESYAYAVIAFARHRLFAKEDDAEMSAFWRAEYERDLLRIKGDAGRRRPKRRVPSMWMSRPVYFRRPQ